MANFSFSTTTTTTAASAATSVTSHFPHSSATKRHSATVSTSVSFSLRPPTPPRPLPPPDPSNSPSVRRPKTLKPSPTPAPKIPKNPLKNLISPSRVPNITTPSNKNNNYSLSSKLWLSSKLSPPPPPPPPPPSPPPPAPAEEIEEELSRETETRDCESQEIEEARPELRQEGKIFVGNLPYWIKKQELSEFFRQFGPIKSAILIKGHKETARNAGFAFVIYDGPMADNAAMKAVEFDGVEFHGRVLTVKLDDGRRLKEKVEERKRWVEGEDRGEYRSKWHEKREGSKKAFQKVLETQPENWQAVVSAFERITKVRRCGC